MEKAPLEFTQYVRTLVSRGRLLLATDLDGTIAATTNNPEEAVVDPAIRSSLKRLLAAGVSVAIITGRGAIVGEYLVGIPGITIIGANGAELRRGGQSQLAPEFAPHAHAISERLHKIHQHILTLIKPIAIRQTPMGNVEVDTSQGTILVEQKGITDSSPHGISTMYYFDKYQDRAITLEVMRVARRLYNEMFRGVLAELITFESSDSVLSFTPLLQAPKWQALARLIQEGVALKGQDRLRSVIYIGDSGPDAPALRMLRIIDKVTNIRTLGVAVMNEQVSDAQHQSDQDELVEAAMVQLPNIQSNVDALSYLVERIEQHRG